MSNLNPDFQDFDFILPSYNPFNLDKGLKSFVIGSWDHIVQIQTSAITNLMM